jgi:hypothetical protein
LDEILLMVHFLGLGLGFAGAAGVAVLIRQAQATPGDGPVVAALLPMFLRTGEVGLALMWITGPWLFADRYANAAVPWTFWAKFLCVVGVTGGVILVDLNSRWATEGSADARQRLRLYGAGTGLLLLLVVIFAVVTFD